MKAPAWLSNKASGRVLAAALVLAALLGFGRPWRHLVGAETADADAFVEVGRRALTAGDRGAAVLAFERARALAPRSELVRSAVDTTDTRDIEPAVIRASRFVTPREWLALATVFGWASALAIGYALVRAERKSRRTATWSAAVAGAACLVASAGVVIASTHPLAVVEGDEARLLVAPYPNAAVNATLPGGSMVILGRDFGGFQSVHAADGATGWLERRSIEPVTQSGS